MKIAVTYDNGNIFQHFGHTEYFKLYEIVDYKVKSSEVVSSEGFGHESLAEFLFNNQVVALICGGIGAGAVYALNMANIRVFGGVSGDADAAVNALLDGTLQFSSCPNCHHHEDEHSCGEHSCGGHSCEDHDCGHHCH